MEKQICIWGKSYGLERVIELLRFAGVTVSVIFDNNPDKWGLRICDCEVIQPGRLSEINPENILVMSRAYDAICTQAVGMGYPRERMIDFYCEDSLTLVYKMTGKSLLSHHTYSLNGHSLVTKTHWASVNGKATTDVSVPIDVEQQQQIVARLLEAFLAARSDACSVPPVYQVGDNWKLVLDGSWGKFYSLANKLDVAGCTEMLGNFCRNVLSNCIFGGEAAYRSFCKHKGFEKWLQHNFEVWEALLDGKGIIEDAAMPPIGNPYGYDVDGYTINWNSFVNHWRASRCLQLLETVSHPVIAEIGGGFGGFAYQLLRRGRPLTYVNFDLPENLLISSYYLSVAFPEKRILVYDCPTMSLDKDVIEQFDIVLMPNFMIPAMQDMTADYFINTISMSEMDHRTICEYLSQIDRIGSRYFYNENLSCHPEYEGFPSSVFPPLANFRQQFVSFSPWAGLDAYSFGHTYLERLFAHKSLFIPEKS